MYDNSVCGGIDFYWICSKQGSLFQFCIYVQYFKSSKHILCTVESERASQKERRETDKEGEMCIAYISTVSWVSTSH